MAVHPHNDPSKANAEFWKAYFAKFRARARKPDADGTQPVLNRQTVPRSTPQQNQTRTE